MQYTYTLNKNELIRKIEFQSGNSFESLIHLDNLHEGITLSPDDDYFQRWLQCEKRPKLLGSRGDIRIVDLFCGCGGMSLGIAEACRALDYKFVPVLGADMDPVALQVYKDNFKPHHVISEPIENQIDSEIGAEISEKEKRFIDLVGKVDILIGGPPCQGNSDLNNHTRREDPRNLLYLKMIRCAEIIKPRFIIIENVPGVQHDKHNVVGIATRELKAFGYHVDSGVVLMSDIGVPQRRKRFFLIASMEKKVSLKKAIDAHYTDEKSVKWAIEDILSIENETIFNTPANSSATNKKRIDYLFDNDIYDLPNSERPDCHRLKKHSYTSVYGRMYWDQPSPTITGGFGSNGQGRFVHPMRRRTITPHEAARLQFFPDYFVFNDVKRRELQQIIGNAVPSKASYMLGIELLGEAEE